MAEGVCRLTETRGRYVKSHLIPQAFTKPEEPGLPLIQVGKAQPSKRRWSSWYDQKLVTAEGEVILRDLDTWAIEFLRKAKLVWSGWGPALSLPDNKLNGKQHKWGLRTVAVPEKGRLRLFMISLLWRSAATTLPEFREIALPPEDLETLRLTLLRGVLPPLDFYPATLAQLSTLGIRHNQTPITGSRPIFSLDGTAPLRQLPIFRFYFDGLIIHFHRQNRDDGDTAGLGNLVIGASEKLIVSTLPYEASFQERNLFKNILGSMSSGKPSL
ncbi:hypothetical protein DXT98_01095 [Agrobacterium sp. ICMP 7243]|nr:hypothetical protein DXT98_01095 [Agrobacterium sp. ICMP 7243]